MPDTMDSIRALGSRLARLQLEKSHVMFAKIIIGSYQSRFKCGASGIDRLLFCEILVIVGFSIVNGFQTGGRAIGC